MKLNEINPFVRNVTSGMFTKKGTDFRVCGDCRLIFIKSGKGKAETKRGVFYFEEGSVLLIPADTPYSLSYSGSPFGYVIISFDYSQDHSMRTEPAGVADEKTYLKLKIIEHSSVPEFKEFMIIENTAVDDIISLISAEFDKRQVAPYAYEMMSALLKQVLIRLIRIKNAKCGKVSTLLDEITEYLKNHIKDNFDNSKIAEHFGYHPYYLSKLFKDSTGRSMHAYFLNLKCESAAKMLSDTNLKISDIALLSGFESQSHFSGVFSKVYGTSPREYRKKFRD